jgi:putative hydrolase of the HAD superfamily
VTETAQRAIRGVLFDLDNTLYNRDRAFSQWADAFIAAQFPDHTPEERAEIHAVTMILDARGYTTKAILFTQLKERYPTIETPVEEICEAFYAGWLQYMTLDPSTIALLDQLAARQIPFGIITNGPVQQELKIRQMGLDARTDCIFVSDLFGCAKPDARIFHAAAEALGVPCEEILFVGDNPHADILGASAVGMTTAWIPAGAEWPQNADLPDPHYTIQELHEVAGILW